MAFSRVHRVRFELKMGSKTRALAAQDIVSRFAADTLPGLLEAALAGLDDDGEALVFDALRLDVGTIRANALATELPIRVERALAEALARAQLGDADGMGRARKVPLAEARLQILVRFLSQGLFEPPRDPGEPKTPQALLDALLANGEKVGRELARRLDGDPRALRRLALGFSEATLERLIANAAPELEPAILQRAQASAPALARDVVRERALSAVFTAAAGVSSPRGLAERIVAAVSEAGQDEAAARPGVVETKRSDKPLPAVAEARLQILVGFLSQGLFEPSRDPGEPTTPQALLDALLAHGEKGGRELARRLGGDPRALRRLASGFSEATLARLIANAAPGLEPAILQRAQASAPALARDIVREVALSAVFAAVAGVSSPDELAKRILAAVREAAKNEGYAAIAQKGVGADIERSGAGGGRRLERGDPERTAPSLPFALSEPLRRFAPAISGFCETVLLAAEALEMSGKMARPPDPGATGRAAIEGLSQASQPLDPREFLRRFAAKIAAERGLAEDVYLSLLRAEGDARALREERYLPLVHLIDALRADSPPPGPASPREAFQEARVADAVRRRLAGAGGPRNPPSSSEGDLAALVEVLAQPDVAAGKVSFLADPALNAAFRRLLAGALSRAVGARADDARPSRRRDEGAMSTTVRAAPTPGASQSGPEARQAALATLRPDAPGRAALLESVGAQGRAGVDRLVALLTPPPRPARRAPGQEIGSPAGAGLPTSPAVAAGGSISAETHVGNAGLVLLHAYFPMLFARLELLRDGGFPGLAEQSRAVDVSQYLAFGDTGRPEYELALDKLLCGLEPADPLPPSRALEDRERDLCEGLLRAALQAWKPLTRSSIATLREGFLQREGRLWRSGEGWELAVVAKPYDLLLDSVPWPYKLTKTRWMRAAIQVRWR